MSKKEVISPVIINGIEYVPKISNEFEKNNEDLPYVIIRTYSAGVHFGYLKKRTSTLAGIEVELAQAQRMRYWEGAMDLSQLAMEGSTKPEKCQPSIVVDIIELVAIEIIPIKKEVAVQLKTMKIHKV